MKTYLRHRIYNVVDVKELIALEHLDFEGKYKNYREAHDFWELCYVEEGEVTLTVDAVKHTLFKNQLFVIAPNRQHSYFSKSGNKSRVFVVCFESFSHNLIPLADNLFSLKSAEATCIKQVINESTSTFMTNSDELLEVRSEALFGGQQALLLQLEYLLICLLRHLSSRQDSAVIFCNDENFHRELTDAIIRFLRENLSRHITLSDVCDKFSYSRSFICKVFKEQTGQTLTEYANRIKISEACRLLRETPLRISEISASLGFNEVKYFDSLFKKRTGSSPNVYRKEHKNGKNN